MEFFDPIQSINKSQLAQAAQLLYLPCLQHVTTYTRDKTRTGQGCQDKSHHRSCHMLSWDTVNSSQGSRRFGHLIHPPQKSCYPHESGLTLFFKLHVSMGQVLLAKYFPQGTLFTGPQTSRGSHIWTAISIGANLLRGEMRWYIEDGQTIRIWQDPWLPNGTLRNYIEGPLVDTLFCNLHLTSHGG